MKLWSTLLSKVKNRKQNEKSCLKTMDKRKISPNGMVVTPHHLATQSGLAILREGGTAIEATVAAAATIAVVYPHMNSIGGDSFWLIVPPDGEPIVVEACGAAGSLATHDFFEGYRKIPYTGPKSAITVAGTVGGWQEALNYVSDCGCQRVFLSRLLEDAIRYADEGFPVSSSHKDVLQEYIISEKVSQNFNNVYLPNGELPTEGQKFCQQELAQTLKHLAKYGLNSFYRGKLADLIANDMSSLGTPITKSDLQNYKPIQKIPLRLQHKHGEIFNAPPPTQGLVSLSILGILEKLQIDGKDEGLFIHTTVEATKQAFDLRDKYITDSKFMSIDPQELLASNKLVEMAKNIELDKASTAGSGKGPGDTIWMGVMDNKGFSVSFIQSIYHSFGSGVVLPRTGILWHNRGVSFSLEKEHLLSLEPGKLPFHTLNPAAARLSDGRVMIYGTRGGDGQPQTQTAVFHRYVVQGHSLPKSITAPRWLFGRISGDHDDSLKLENRFSQNTIDYLKERGHKIELLPPFSGKVGHAGALVRYTDGMMEGASDPRSDGSAAGF